MTLNLISLGLGDPEGISFRGLKLAKQCDELWLEQFTTKLAYSSSELSDFLGKSVNDASRKLLEDRSQKFLNKARKLEVGLLVGGDALTATTHLALLCEAKSKGIKTRVVHGSSILTAVAETGLSLYKFGRTTSIPWPKVGWKPESPYQIIRKNKKNGLHTLVLLDLKKGRQLSPQKALKLLLNFEKKKKKVISGKVLVFSLRRKSIFSWEPIKKLLKMDFEAPSCIIFPGKLSDNEKNWLKILSNEHQK